MSYLLRNMLALDGFRDSAAKCDVVVDGSKITALEPAGSVEPEGHNVIDGKGRTALIPGLVNTHTHAAMTLLRGLGEEKPLMDWLKKSIWPVEARLTPSSVYWGTMLGALEMLSGGVTCFGDMYFEMDEVARACLELGMKCGISRGLVGADRERIDDNIRLYKTWDKKEDLLRVQFGPHAPYTVPLEQLREVSSVAHDLGAGAHFHFLEVEWELQYLREEYDMDPLTYLSESGLLGLDRLILAHGVWISENIMQDLALSSVTVVHSIKSNLKLGSGIMDLPGMLDKNISVALGTDGAASNNQLDVWDEMKTVALVHKGQRKDPTVVKAGDVLRMATYEGARALGFEGTGRIEPGWKADLALVDLDRPHYVGVSEDNLGCYLVYAGSKADVKSTIINGKPVYSEGRLLNFDKDEIILSAREERQRLVE